jgi:hypothetical protein
MATSTPSGPPAQAPASANGIVPSVALPQLKAVERSGKPRLLNEAFARNRSPLKNHAAPAHGAAQGWAPGTDLT